ncbi:MAG: phosphatidylserine decarboxylase [Ignisphaera sp.]
MKTLKEWLESPEVKRIKEIPISEYCEKEFLRDPFRPIFYRPNILYSPADGIILYAKEVNPTTDIIDIKGKGLTVRDILCKEDYNERSIVIGIMMTAYDVHHNRMPTSGIIEFVRKDSLRMDNLSMVKVEQAIFQGKEPSTQDMDYIFYNERQICKVYCPHIRQEYYIVQIADLEVDAVSNLYFTGSYLLQGTKFSTVLFGSQVDLVVPIKKYNEYRNLVKDKITYHVEAGIDPLIEVILK